MKQPTKLKLKIFHEAYTLKRKKTQKDEKKNIWNGWLPHINF